MSIFPFKSAGLKLDPVTPWPVNVPPKVPVIKLLKSNEGDDWQNAPGLVHSAENGVKGAWQPVFEYDAIPSEVKVTVAPFWGLLLHFEDY